MKNKLSGTHTKHGVLHILSAQNRDRPSICLIHLEHMMLVLYSSTNRTCLPSLLFSSLYRPLTGVGPYPQEELEKRPSPKATNVPGLLSVIWLQIWSYAFA